MNDKLKTKMKELIGWINKEREAGKEVEVNYGGLFLFSDTDKDV